jgi:hypothetical protein
MLYFKPCPKAGKRSNAAPKRLKRSPIKPGRTKFNEFGANPFKTYRRRYSDAQVLAMAMKRRAERFANPTAAEIAFSTMLTRLGIKHVREKIILNGDRFVLLDIWLPKWNLVVELEWPVSRQSKNVRPRPVNVACARTRHESRPLCEPGRVQRKSRIADHGDVGT